MNRELLRLVIHRMTFLTAREKQNLYDQWEDEPLKSPLECLLSLGRVDMGLILGRKVQPRSWKPEAWVQGALEDLEAIRSWQQDQWGGGVLVLDEPGYPELLSTIYDAPYLLFFRGTLEALERPAAALVGTRKPSLGGSRGAFRMAREAAEAGFLIVSGMARGIDGSAHRGALKGGGRTAAVLGTGLNRFYPEEHRRLGHEILNRGGILLSEYPPETPPRAWNFPGRNRIISGLSQAVIVAEAPLRSGALITAEFALEQGRELLVLRDGLFSGAAGGCRELEAAGAPVVQRGGDLLGFINPAGWQIEDEDDTSGGGKTRGLTPSMAAQGAALAQSLREEMASSRGGLNA